LILPIRFHKAGKTVLSGRQCTFETGKDLRPGNFPHWQPHCIFMKRDLKFKKAFQIVFKSSADRLRCKLLIWRQKSVTLARGVSPERTIVVLDLAKYVLPRRI